MIALLRPLCLMFLIMGGLTLVACEQKGTTPSTVATAREKTDQRAIIDAAIRTALNRPAWRLLGASQRARVTTLDFSKTTLTDVGAAILAEPSTGLKALTTLSLSGMHFGDAGAAALAAPDTGLMALTTLYLNGSQVGDAGAAALAAKDTGLKALTQLELLGTQVGDAGAAAIKQRFPGITIYR